MFNANAVCWGRYQTVGQLVNEDPSCSEQNPLFTRISQPGIGSTLAPSIPLDFASHRMAASPAPLLGAHTEEVLVELLGLSSSEFGRLVDEGVVALATRSRSHP